MGKVEEYYPHLIAKGNLLVCTLKKEDDKKIWSCELDKQRFKAELIRFGTERPIMASSAFVMEENFVMGGLKGSKVECRSTGKINGRVSEIYCVLRGV